MNRLPVVKTKAITMITTVLSSSAMPYQPIVIDTLLVTINPTNGEVVGSVPHTPQFRAQRFHYDDIFDKNRLTGVHGYSVRAVDAAGTAADSRTLTADPGTVT